MGTHPEWEWKLEGDRCFDNMAELGVVCGTDAVSKDTVKRLMSQPEGAAWTVWTPLAGN
jgi:hypothetical protein